MKIFGAGAAQAYKVETLKETRPNCVGEHVATDLGPEIANSDSPINLLFKFDQTLLL